MKLAQKLLTIVDSRSPDVDALVKEYSGKWDGWAHDQEIVSFKEKSQAHMEEFAAKVRKLSDVAAAKVGMYGVQIKWVSKKNKRTS